MTGSRSRSLTDRIRHEAQASGIDPQRLRRRVVFHRILARVGTDPRWVLKGGFCLEVRLGLASRATRDLDLVASHGWGTAGALDLQDELDSLLDRDLDGDGFGFAVSCPRTIRADGREVWRVGVEAWFDGRRFAQVSLDVVVQSEELAGGVADLEVASPAAVADLPAVRIRAVDVDQHAAEKIHAYSRTYAHDTPSSRVKDLVDLALLMEAGVLNVARLWERLVVVHRLRDGTEPPVSLPPPPSTWDRDYAALVRDHDLTLAASTVDAAYDLLITEYAEARRAGEGHA